MTSFPGFRPALRSVDINGNVTIGPTQLFQPNTFGIFCEDTDVSYEEHRLGLWSNLAYSFRAKQLGLRPHVTLALKVIDASKIGLDNLQRHYRDGVASETFPQLQFTPFYTGTAADLWRGMVPVSNWAPKAIDGKWGVGWQVTLELSAWDLIPIAGFWRTSGW